MQRRTLLILALFALLALVIRAAYVQHGRIIYDEFQHMHAAYLLAQGQTPFADFFEHHTPLFYYLAAAVVPLQSPSFDTMIAARYLSLAFHLLTIVFVVLWVRAFADRASAIVVGVLLSANVCFFIWGCRTYLDTYAAPFLVISAWALRTREGSAGRCFVSALALALAVLFTQKAVFAALAPASVFVSRALRELPDPHRRRGWWIDLGAYAAGGLLPVLLLPALLGVEGLAAFWRDAVVLNLHWKAERFPWREFQVLLATDAFVYLATVVGLGATLWRIARQRLAVESADVAALSLFGLGVGAFLLPVVWEEYFVLLLPFAAVVAGRQLLSWWRSSLTQPGAALARTALVGAFAATSVVDLIGLRLAASNPLSLPAFILAPVLWGAIGVLVAHARRRRKDWEPAAWLAWLVAFPLVQQIDWIPRHLNDGDRARVEYIMATTSPFEPIFDGRSGYGVFRPHAYWYWFLHDEMQLMLSDRQRGPDVIRALEERRVPVAIVDDFTRMLPASVLEYIAAHYADTPFPDVKIRRSEIQQGE